MAPYGVTTEGFRVKEFRAILEDKVARAREMFGEEVSLDLRSSSALRKVLDIATAEDHELWKRMEQLYYSNFVSTASGRSLDHLGGDVGVPRRPLFAHGNVTFEVTGAAPGRTYHLPVGTLVETDPPVQRFRTQRRVSLSEQNPKGEADVEAVERGPGGNVAAQAIKKINTTYAQKFLNLGAATIKVENPQPTDGGDGLEDDGTYRDRLLGYPRTLWTLEAVRHTVKHVDGVRDCRLFDPLGGVDVSLSKFNFFRFAQRRFGMQRLLGSPYYFDIVVALHAGFLWESAGGVMGVKDAIEAAIQEVRPISIFPNLRRANHVQVGIRAKILVRSGHDKSGVLTAIKERLERRVNTLGLGGSVLYSDVMLDCRAAPEVIDVQQLHLRRCPALVGTIAFGARQRFQEDCVEAAVGENLTLLPEEIAVFNVDSELIDIQVGER